MAGSPGIIFLFDAMAGPAGKAEKLFWIFRNPYSASLYAILLLGLTAYYIWLIRKGRPEAKEVFFPVFRPPFGMSPAAVRYMYSLGFDTKCLVAAIMSASVKGFYKIHWANRGLAAFASKGADKKKTEP